MPEHADKVALVTAGARRLGRAISLRLAELGYDVALHYHSSASEAAQVKAQITSSGRRCEIFQADLNRTDEVLQLIAQVTKRMAAPVLLVNNASTFEKNDLLSATPEQFDGDFNLHVKAPFFLTREFAIGCERGQIINLVDTSVTRQQTDYFTYLLSKKTLLDLTKMTARALAPRIRVNAIAPGVILPPPGIEREDFRQFLENNPLQRAASPQDVLQALDYLLKAEQVTGECLFVDGGDHIAW